MTTKTIEPREAKAGDRVKAVTQETEISGVLALNGAQGLSLIHAGWTLDRLVAQFDLVVITREVHDPGPEDFEDSTLFLATVRGKSDTLLQNDGRGDDLPWVAIDARRARGFYRNSDIDWATARKVNLVEVAPDEQP